MNLGVLFVCLLFAFNCKGENSAAVGGPEGNFKSYAVNVILLNVWPKKDGQVQVQLAAKDDHAIQISNLNKVTLSVAGRDFKIGLKGNPRSDKPEYYQSVEPVQLKVGKATKAKVKGRVLFCNLTQGYCSKVDLDLDVPLES